MKSKAARAEVGSHEDSRIVSEAAVRRARDVRVEDLGDGYAQISLRLPWSVVLQVLDLTSAAGSARKPALT